MLDGQRCHFDTLKKWIEPFLNLFIKIRIGHRNVQNVDEGELSLKEVGTQ